VEFKAHGGLAPELRENRRKGALFREKRLVFATNDPAMTLWAQFKGLSPTGC
jgi:hypothetical protein